MIPRLPKERLSDDNGSPDGLTVAGTGLLNLAVVNGFTGGATLNAGTPLALGTLSLGKRRSASRAAARSP